MKLIDFFDARLVPLFRKWSVPLLRVALGIVFFWFGGLKLLGISPVHELIAKTYWFLPTETFVTVLALWEMIIGVGLLAKIFLRSTLLLLWLQMAGTFVALLLAPKLFFIEQMPFFLTTQGEFVVKNLVLVAASLVIAAYEVTPKESSL